MLRDAHDLHLWNGLPCGVTAGFTTTAYRGVEPETDVRAIAQRLGIGCERVAWMKQVHSDGLIIDMPNSLYPQEADAVMTSHKNVFLVVKTADCVPVFLIDAQCRALGMVHAGRRSAGMGLVPKTIAAMGHEYGVEPCDVTAYIGPCIRAHNYEVKADVYDDPVFAPYCRDLGGKTVLDLSALLKAQLATSGVAAVFDCGLCTFDEKERFYSFRRGDGERRVISFAVME